MRHISWLALVGLVVTVCYAATSRKQLEQALTQRIRRIQRSAAANLVVAHQPKSEMVVRRSRRSAQIVMAPTPTAEVVREMQLTRRERRILRKKKQRLKELKEEIRLLSMQLQDPTGSPLPSTITRGRTAAGKQRTAKEDRWKRKLLEKMKLIVRRLARMERKVIDRNVKERTSGGKKMAKLAGTTSMPLLTTIEPSTTPIAVRSSIGTPVDHSERLRRIQSSMVHARTGDNGTACATHRDCRPGRCCHRITTKSTAVEQQCLFHAFSVETACIDSCQCAHGLHCYQPNDNSTAPFCKRAEKSDIMEGAYLYNPSSVFAHSSKKRR